MCVCVCVCILVVAVSALTHVVSGRQEASVRVVITPSPVTTSPTPATSASVNQASSLAVQPVSADYVLMHSASQYKIIDVVRKNGSTAGEDVGIDSYQPGSCLQFNIHVLPGFMLNRSH